MAYFFLIFIIIIIILIAFLRGDIFIEPPEKRAGRLGEEYVASVIKEILNKDDILLTNIEITIDGKTTEIDNIIINKNGIFIIEVKNYSGQLSGEVDDYEWSKTKVTEIGNQYQKVVKNPIKQVKRQEYFLSRLLKQHGIWIWIRGYVFFVEENSPINNERVLATRKDIDVAIHSKSMNYLDKKTIEMIENLLS